MKLLLACARAHAAAGDEAAIRALLAEGIDWTTFVQKAVAHGLAGLTGHILTRLVPDAVPEEILQAFASFIEQTRNSNQALLDELVRLIASLAEAGVETIPFKGPVLARQAFGDLGLRGFRDLDFLIRDGDVEKTVTILCGQGYERLGKLTPAQFELIHRLQGQEILFKRRVAAVEPHSRLISLKMALDIDYDGLWKRSRPADIFGHQMPVFAAEDTLVVLAIHGGKELWWDIKWACDVADFIAAHPDLDWNIIAERARMQGCTRMLLVATSLARHYLGAHIPGFIVAAEAGDSKLDAIVGRILARWEMDDPGGPPSNKTLSLDRLLLHDGILRQASYVVRTVVLPGPQHIPLLALPRWLGFAYIPIGIIHDRIALPLYRVYEWLVLQTGHGRKPAAQSPATAPKLTSAETRERLAGLQRSYAKAQSDLAANPKNSRSWIAAGDALAGMQKYRDALVAYEKAAFIAPDQNPAWQKRHQAIRGLKKAGDWSDGGDEPSFDSKDPKGWAFYAGFLSAVGRHMEAARASDTALQLAPGHEAAINIGIKSRLLACDWSRRTEDEQLVKTGLAGSRAILSPFNLRTISDSEEESLACARLWTKGLARTEKPYWSGERYRHDRMRVAYLSSDFRSHPVGTTIIAPLEHHDRSRFEITALSLTPKPDCPVQERIKTAVEHFIDIHKLDDEAVAGLLREREIDIAIDLNGLSGTRRSRILMRRPVPLQAAYLGYPGTTAMPFMDYVIADRSVVPEENQVFYSEKVAYLPNSYLPYDRKRRIAQTLQGRSIEGLPETGFVFACFNRPNKIAPAVFEVWMRLLSDVESSVLWLAGDRDPAVMENIRREAAARGVAPERIVFAAHKDRIEDHLARQALADLFLDTWPYNAHSTAGDALWAGLPVLTLRGRAFHSRVAAGVLQAIGLPELITGSLGDYERLALALARDPARLAAIRAKLAANRDITPLFDAAAFTRGLEAVFTGMWQRQQSGLPPDSFVADAS
ncbi:MAG TPA: nucleotidyltransferase family protein [Rhizomicrobium sp.]|nr:nucleotidyltransferase family protein [Rhizomicrobium sp.]